MGIFKFVGIYTLAAWGVIAALSLMVVGGLVLWAYGARRKAGASFELTGPEADSTQFFHARLARWFFVYGLTVIALGAGLLLWASLVFF